MFKTANLLGQLIVGRRPEFAEVPLWRANGVSYKGAPDAPSSGVALQNSPKTRVVVDLREDAARFGHRLRVTSLAGPHTVTIDGLAHNHAGPSSTVDEILDDLASTINAGVDLGTLTLTFSGSTVVRSSGDWSSDGVLAGAQLTFAEVTTGLNDELTVTIDSVAGDTATLIAADVTDPESGVDYVVQARRQVTAVVEDRPEGLTLVLRTRLGEEQVDTLAASALLNPGELIAQLARETTVQTVTTTANLSIEQDATTCDVELFTTARGGNAPAGWRAPNECRFSGLDYRGFDERIDTAGCARADLAVRNANGIVRAWLGPAVQEIAE